MHRNINHHVDTSGCSRIKFWSIAYSSLSETVLLESNPNQQNLVRFGLWWLTYSAEIVLLLKLKFSYWLRWGYYQLVELHNSCLQLESSSSDSRFGKTFEKNLTIIFLLSRHFSVWWWVVSISVCLLTHRAVTKIRSISSRRFLLSIYFFSWLRNGI
jgi:hypothetical protein